LILLKQNQS